MKYYLSSFKIGDDPQKLKNMLSQKKKAVYISNAFDRYPQSEGVKKRRAEDQEQLREIGLIVEPLDLRQFFGKQDELRQRLKGVGLIWVSGGNVYDLRIAMKLSGFDNIVQSLLNEDIVYGGYSAAVCVLSPTLKGYHIVDATEGNPYGQETMWEGLGLIDWQFAPHFDSDHPESKDVQKEIAYYQEHGMKYKALRDGEVVILDLCSSSADGE